jgi:putative two-component system response regulator
MSEIKKLIHQNNKKPLVIAAEIVDYYRSLPRHLIQNRPEIIDAINAWHQTLEIGHDHKSIDIRVAYCNVYFYRIIGNGENVFRWGLQAVYDNPTSEDITYVGWIHRLISAMSFALGLIDQATEHADKALQLFLTLDNPDEIIRSYIQLGIAYDYTENYSLQLEYFSKSYDLAKKIDSENTMLIALNNTIFVHILRDEYEIAREKLMVLQERLDEDDYSRLAIGAKLNATRLALHDDELEYAKVLLDQVSGFQLLKSDLAMYLDSILLYGRYYSEIGEINKGIRTFQAGLNKALQSASKKYQLEFLHELAKLNKEIKNYEEALKCQEDYISITKEIAHEHASFHYLFLKVQYEMDQISKKVSRLKNQLNKTQETTIYTLATLAEYKDQITGKHVLRTIEYVEAFCRLINGSGILEEPFTETFINNFARSSALHDIGKVGVSDAILKKPGKLSIDEFESIKQHTTLGRDALAITETIMKRTSFLKLAETIAYTHHEKWDGSGYPLGLKGEEIPFEGRLVAIIDVYDALISKRPYKPPYSHVKALSIMKEGRGKHFDPRLLDLFLENHTVFFEIARRLLDSDNEKHHLSSKNN